MQAIALRAFAGRRPIIAVYQFPGIDKKKCLDFQCIDCQRLDCRFVFIDTDRADPREFQKGFNNE